MSVPEQAGDPPSNSVGPAEIRLVATMHSGVIKCVAVEMDKYTWFFDVVAGKVARFRFRTDEWGREVGFVDETKLPTTVVEALRERPEVARVEQLSEGQDEQTTLDTGGWSQ